MPTNSQWRTTGVSYGVDQLVADRTRLPLDARLGLLTNDAAVTAADSTVTSREALLRAGVRLVRLFSPEHGIHAVAADGAAVSHGNDPVTGLPVVSLYGEQVRPTLSTLADLDGVVVDLPDVGTRFYTFIWTMSYMLEACAEAGLPLWILDRPNPIGGNLSMAEGPLLDEAHCAGFLGRFSIPVRHSLTVGELAKLWNTEQQLHTGLEVIRATGWQRADQHPATGLSFVPPSPGIPSYMSALCYPGTCLFEATNLSVGRGTALTFQVVGAPWLEAEPLHESFTSLQLPGVASEVASFTPSMAPYRGEECHGIRLVITDSAVMRPVAMGLHLLALVIEHSHKNYRWSSYPTAVNPTSNHHFEKLIGRTDVAEALEAREIDLSAKIAEWTATPGWEARVEMCLCYSNHGSHQ